MKLKPTFWRHDTQHNDTQHKDTQHNDIQHKDTQHKDTQHNDTQLKETQHNDTQQNNKKRDTQHNNIQHNDTTYCNAECHLCCVSQTSPLCRVSFCWMPLRPPFSVEISLKTEITVKNLMNFIISLLSFSDKYSFLLSNKFLSMNENWRRSQCWNYSSVKSIKTECTLLIPGNTKGGSITVLSTSCLTGLD